MLVRQVKGLSGDTYQRELSHQLEGNSATCGEYVENITLRGPDNAKTRLTAVILVLVISLSLIAHAAGQTRFVQAACTPGVSCHRLSACSRT